MGFFSKILDKLGLNRDKEEAKPAAPAATVKPAAPVAAAKPAVPAAKPATPAPKPAAAAAAAPAVKPPTAVPSDDAKGAFRPAPAAAAPKPISEVDVVKQLDQLAVGKNLNWKVSIVDLLKLLDLDSSYEARVELAKELDCPPELMTDSARMNTWLHKTVLKKIAENGGNIPKDLLD
jgi:hypothetical protein